MVRYTYLFVHKRFVYFSDVIFNEGVCAVIMVLRVFGVPGDISYTIKYTWIGYQTRVDWSVLLLRVYVYWNYSTLICCEQHTTITAPAEKKYWKKNNLRRRLSYTPDETVKEYISNEIENSGQCIGYRSMWKRLINDHKLKVPRDKVLTFMRQIDPEGIALRKAHRLKRRKYRVKGPNYVWHVDGYDKLKPYGFCIHGAIDGYSRRILWLEVSETNNNPGIIAMYYLEALKEIRVVPRILRCDHGTENSTLALLQPFFRIQWYRQYGRSE